MVELESLSNKELRQKCIEHGMPNVPVTDSSRKILIRRLEAAISGKPTAPTPKKANRRETMHVSKPAEVMSSPKVTANSNATKETSATNSRPSRRTIAVPERHVTTTTTVSEPEFSDVSPDRAEPVPVKAKTKAAEKPQILLYPKLPAKEPSPKPQVLSKTGIVTTSYVQETTPIGKTYATPEEIELIEDDVAEEAVEKTITNPIKFGYVPVSEPKVTTTASLAASLSSSTRYSSLDAYNLNKPNILSSTNVQKTYIPSSNYSKSLGAQKYSKTYEPDVENEDDYEDEEDDVILVDESPIKDAETPFLSQFARNLENIKATPLRHSVGPTKISPPKSTLHNRDNAYYRRTVASPLASINPRRSITKTNYNGDFEFRQFIIALDEKYHLKHSLILICIFILIIFIYVFFIQSV